MGIAMDSVGALVVNPGATLTAATPATGDSFTVRNGAPGSLVRLENITRAGLATGEVSVKSPLLHDNVFGIRFGSATTPQKWTLPHETGQLLQSQDNLSVTLTGGTAETDIAILSVFYDNLPGATSRLHMWGDIAGNIANYKTVKVACNTGAALGQWVDTALNTTENLLKANTDYAILGYLLDAEIAAVAVKGSDTGNLRIHGPGYIAVEDTTDYFVRWANDSGRPHIPVFNSANVAATFVSTINNVASVAVNVYVMLAQMAQNLSS